MTAIELAKILGRHIAQGRGEHEVCMFQWGYGAQVVGAALLREGVDAIELYSNVSIDARTPNNASAAPVTQPTFDDDEL